MSYRLTHETPDALDAINQVLASSITAWQLSDRLYRLSVNAFRYHHSDWIDHQSYGLRNEHNTLVEILVVNEDSSDLPDDHLCLQIQGLFIEKHNQKRRLGSRLIHEAAQVALDQSLELLYGCRLLFVLRMLVVFLCPNNRHLVKILKKIPQIALGCGS